MGLFEKKETCTICNIGDGSKKLQDGYICKECIKKCSPFIVPLSWKGISVENVNRAINASNENHRLQRLFNPTKNVEKYVLFDETNRLWKANTSNLIFNYSDVVNFELLEDGETITKGGLGSAVVGGALFGGVGAVVGGVIGKKKTKTEISEYKIKVITRNEMYPEVYINFLTTGSVKSGGLLYNSYKCEAQRVITEFTLITDSLKSNEVQHITMSDTDEIVKYKKLYDDGVITQEEFEKKKKQLLGI